MDERLHHDPMPRLPRSPLAPLVAGVYAKAPPAQRVRLLNGLLGPVGPLALVTISDGAFASLLPRRRWHEGAHATLDDAQQLSAAQVLELASYVEQKSPEVLSQLPDLTPAVICGAAH